MPFPRNQRKSRRQEQAAAARLGGHRVSGSGSGWATKNDVRTDDLSIEIKYTDKKSYTLRLEDLLKAERNALVDSGRESGFLVGFGRATHGSLIIDREFMVISREYYESLRNRGNPE